MRERSQDWLAWVAWIARISDEGLKQIEQKEGRIRGLESAVRGGKRTELNLQRKSENDILIEKEMSFFSSQRMY